MALSSTLYYRVACAIFVCFRFVSPALGGKRFRGQLFSISGGGLVIANLEGGAEDLVPGALAEGELDLLLGRRLGENVWLPSQKCQVDFWWALMPLGFAKMDRMDLSRVAEGATGRDLRDEVAQRALLVQHTHSDYSESAGFSWASNFFAFTREKLEQLAKVRKILTAISCLDLALG